MAVSTDYVGRTVDLCILDTNSLPGIQSVAIGIYDSGKVISGSFKTVQQFVKMLFTDEGSVPADPTYGTEFSTLLFSGQIQTNIILSMEFYAAAPKIMAYIRLNQTEDTPDDEILQKVILSSFTATAGALTLSISFEFVDSSVVLTPVSIPIG